MSSPGRSFQQYRRYAMFRQHGAATPTLLVGAVVVLALSGTFLVFHFLSGGYQRSVLLSNFSSEKRPRSEFLESGQCSAVCYTKECLKTAAAVLQMLDPAADPCKDFYLYACGGYNKIPTEHRKIEAYSGAVEDEAVKLFRDLIQQIPKSFPEGTPGSSLAKIRKFYDSCIDTVTSEQTAVLTAMKYLKHFGIKNWPDLLSGFTFTDPDLDEVLVRLALYKQHPFFRVRFELFLLENQTEEAMSSGFPPEFSTKIEVSYRINPIIHDEGTVDKSTIVLIKEILQYFVPNNTARSDILADVLAFDLELHNLIQRTREKELQCPQTSTSECSSDLTYDCSQKGNYQMGRWCKLAEKILDRSGFLEKNSPTTVYLEDKEYFQELGLLIERTNQRTIAHALAIQFLMINAYFLNSALSRMAWLAEEGVRDIPVKYMSEIQEIGRSEFCIVWASFRMPILAEAAFFGSKYNNSKLRKEINEIYSDIKEVSLSTVQGAPWIDSEPKEVLEKLYSEIYFSPEGHLPYIRNLSEVDDLYKEMDITEGSFLANELEARKLATILYLRNMDNITKLMDYFTIPFKFNPIYDGPPWSIGFELGNLIFPAVTSNRPRYINLGYFGVIVAHELSHPVVKIVFSEANITRSQVFKNALQEKKECFASHYSQYEIYESGQNVNGNYTFRENLPDYLGIRAAFKALKKYQESHGYDEMLPGLHFSPEQMFFIAAAQNWCEAHTFEGLEFYLTDFHSPPQVRLLGAYKNIDDFSEAFSCPPGSPMNPINKCRFD